MARPSGSRPRSQVRLSKRVKLGRPVRGIAAVLLITLVAALLFFVTRPGSAPVCDTADAEKYPQLCGTTTRICNDPAASADVPRPLIIVAAGGVRSSSTWLYNALRILLRIRDPNTVYGWHQDLAALYNMYGLERPRAKNASVTKEEASRVEAYRALGVSVLLKLHLVQDWHEFHGGGDADTNMAPYVDGVFTSHRDVRDVVVSVRDMGWGVSVAPEKLRHPDFCKKRKVKIKPQFLRSNAYKKMSVWVNMAHATIRCHEALLESAGEKLKMDLRSEDIRGLSFEGTVAHLGEMGRHLDYAYSTAELQMAATELRRLRPPRCDGGALYEMELNPITHLHKGHVRFSKSAAAAAAEQSGVAAIASDGAIARWLRAHGYRP